MKMEPHTVIHMIPLCLILMTMNMILMICTMKMTWMELVTTLMFMRMVLYILTHMTMKRMKATITPISTFWRRGIEQRIWAPMISTF